MNRRRFLSTLSCGAAAAPLLAGPPASRRPNIVLIMADDLGYECLSCYGSTSYRTPHLDTLAASGIRFTNAYAQPLCAPTRLQIMTGQYNCRNYEAFGILNPKEKTFGHLMQAAGYKTCIAGKWQLYSYNPPGYQPEWRGKGMLPKDSGFDDYCLWHAGHTEEKGSRYADPVVMRRDGLHELKGQYGEDVFASFLIHFMETHKDEPFFVYYPMVLTHAPFTPTPRSAEWKSGNLHRTDPRFFKDMVEYMDATVGRVVESIDRLGLRENTIILFFSDNGTPREIESRLGGRTIRGGKGLTTDAGTHVPLIANWKGTAPAGKVLDDLIDSTDFLPTIAEAAGIKIPREFTVDGRSFFPQLKGATGKPREWVYSYYDPRPGWDKEQFPLKISARDKRYKLYSTGELYDVVADPLEQSPIPSERQTPEARRSRIRLQEVLDDMKKHIQRQPVTTS